MPLVRDFINKIVFNKLECIKKDEFIIRVGGFGVMLVVLEWWIVLQLVVGSTRK